MLRVEDNTVIVRGVFIEFENKSDLNSFLFDYINKYGRIDMVEKKTVIDDAKLVELIDKYGCIEIENLSLSVRSYNILKRVGINYVEDILKLKFDEVVRLRNLGKRSMTEIEEVVNEFTHSDYIDWTSQLVEN